MLYPRWLKHGTVASLKLAPIVFEMFLFFYLFFYIERYKLETDTKMKKELIMKRAVVFCFVLYILHREKCLLTYDQQNWVSGSK